MIAWINDAPAMEAALIRMLARRVFDAKSSSRTSPKDRGHPDQSRRHADMVDGRLKRVGGSTSTVTPGTGALVDAMQAPLTGTYRDEIEPGGGIDSGTDARVNHAP